MVKFLPYLVASVFVFVVAFPLANERYFYWDPWLVRRYGGFFLILLSIVVVVARQTVGYLVESLKWAPEVLVPKSIATVPPQARFVDVPHVVASMNALAVSTE